MPLSLKWGHCAQRFFHAGASATGAKIQRTMLQTENQDQQKPPIKTEPKIPGTYDPSNRLADNDRLQLQLQCAFAKPARQRERERQWARWSYVWMHDRIWHDLTCLKCFSNLHGSTTLDGKTFSSQLRHELLDQKYTEHSCLHSTGSPTKSEAYFDLFDNVF